MARHRGTFKPDNPEPFELSRSKIEMFVRCEACFWLEKVKGVKQPSMPAFLINSLTDVLLKREMDAYRGIEAHPWIYNQGFPNLIPLDHDDLEDWTDSLQFGASPKKYNTLHEPTNILFGGGIDDMWLNTKNGQYVLVDFKSTANITREKRQLDLSGKYKEGYKRQMDMYLWIGKQRGYPMSQDTYFFYVDGQNRIHSKVEEYEGSDKLVPKVKNLTMGIDKLGGKGELVFNPSFLHYEADDSWVEDTLFAVKKTLNKESCPEHSDGCEHGEYLAAAFEASK